MNTCHLIGPLMASPPAGADSSWRCRRIAEKVPEMLETVEKVACMDMRRETPVFPNSYATRTLGDFPPA
jgi:hypothetical protein